MNDGLVRLVSQRFDTFASRYLEAPGDGFAYTLKIEHTRRVLDISETIACEEKLPERLVPACSLAALLHDVGRFPQYMRYRTFRDADSADHAALSVTYTLREKLLADVPNETRRLVLGAVYLHNKRSLPELSFPDLRTVAQLVRDSDKLDIYRVLLAHFSQSQQHPEVALNVLDEPDKFSEPVLQALQNRSYGDYTRIVYINDFKLMVIGWLYDLNFRSSCRLLKERGYLDILFDSLPRSERLADLRRQITQDLAQRLKDA